VQAEDVARLSAASLNAHRGRTGLILFAMTIAVASVVMLTALGEGARRFVTGEFAALGTHLLFVLPGRTETTGGPPPMLGETPEDLTLSDALALRRSHHVEAVAPIVVGSAPVTYRELEREASILGSTHALFEVRGLTMARGRFLVHGDPRRASPTCVLGEKVANELLRGRSPLGAWIRIGGYRCRVVGVLAAKGVSLGMDIADTVIVPVASAQSIFNTEGLFRVIVQARNRASIDDARTAILDILSERHGRADVTVLTQDAVLNTFDRILHALTLTVAGIAAVSLAVAGILIMNVMLVAVSQRTAEVGLLKALGARNRDVAAVFMAEAGLLALVGAALGLAVAGAVTWMLAQAVPQLPAGIPLWSAAAAVLIALGTGLTFGLLPARRAARLDPVRALAGR